VTASLCNSSYDTKIGVFDGSCASLNCIGGNDDNSAACGSGGQSEFSWGAVTGEDYYILVHGWNSNAGNYTLDLTCAAVTSPSVPTLSEWGLIILALLLMTFGTLHLIKRESNKTA